MNHATRPTEPAFTYIVKVGLPHLPSLKATRRGQINDATDADSAMDHLLRLRRAVPSEITHEITLFDNNGNTVRQADANGRAVPLQAELHFAFDHA